MQSGGGGFAAAVTDQDQLVDYKLTVTLPVSVPSYYQDLTKCLVSVDINRAVVTSLPDGTTLISGYPSAACTLVLAGMLNQAPGVPLKEADSAFKLFNPNDSTSVMWRTTRGGLPVTFQAGYWDGATSSDLVTQYTGTVDQVTCSNGVVTLVCRDQRSTVTNQATLPPVITAAPFNAGLTAEYAVDYLLRHSSPSRYYSWPAERAGCVCAVGFRTSLWPEVGSYAAYTQTPSFGAGLYGYALTGNTLGNVYTFASPITQSQSYFQECFGSIGTEIHVNNPAANYRVDWQYRSDGKLHIYVVTPSGTSADNNWAVSLTGIHYIGVSFTWAAGSTSIAGTVRIDGTSHALSLTALDSRPSDGTGVFTLGAVYTGTNGTIEGYQVTTETSPAFNDGFSPTLILDSSGSLQQLTAMPDVSGKDAWTVLQGIAAAECAVIGFDETGICRFVNRRTLKLMTAVRSITSSASLISLDSLEQMSLCATHIQVPVNQLSLQSLGSVWESNTPIGLPIHGSVTINVTTVNPVVNVNVADSGFYPDSGAVAGRSYWRGCTTEDGTGVAITTGVSFTIEQLSATSLAVTINNANWVPVWLVSPPGFFGTVTPESADPLSFGMPLMIIGGQAVVATGSNQYADAQWPPVSAGGATSNPMFGEVLLQVPASDWLQSVDSAQSLADDLLSDLHYPKPLFRNVSIIADPRLQLLDRVTLVDPDVSQVNDDALIVGIETQMSAGQWTQTIDAKAMHRPGSWVLGQVGRSELGSTTFVF